MVIRVSPHMKPVLLIAAFAVAALLSSCNTFIGMGRDMKLLGDGMESSANKANGSGSDGGDTSGAPVY